MKNYFSKLFYSKTKSEKTTIKQVIKVEFSFKYNLKSGFRVLTNKMRKGFSNLHKMRNLNPLVITKKNGHI